VISRGPGYLAVVMTPCPPLTSVSSTGDRQEERDNYLTGECLMINKFLIFSTQIWMTGLGIRMRIGIHQTLLNKDPGPAAN